jgi:hypothetical protein
MVISTSVPAVMYKLFNCHTVLYCTVLYSTVLYSTGGEDRVDVLDVVGLVEGPPEDLVGALRAGDALDMACSMVVS